MITALHIGQNHLVTGILLDISSRDIDSDTDNDIDNDNDNDSDNAMFLITTQLSSRLASAYWAPGLVQSPDVWHSAKSDPGRSHSKHHWTCDKLHLLF